MNPRTVVASCTDIHTDGVRIDDEDFSQNVSSVISIQIKIKRHWLS